MYVFAYAMQLLALLCALGGGGMALLQLWQGRADSLRLIEKAHWVVTGGLLLASALLLHALYWHDFSLQYVASYTDLILPVFYRLTAFWAGQPGSMLFWALAVSLSGSIFACTRACRNLSPATKLWYWTFFYVIMAFFTLILTNWSNPFLMQTPAPADGNGLNPLLQNPGMIFHPPLLFLGYGGFTVPACLALAQALSRRGRCEGPWFRLTRPFIILAWLFLTAGIVLGAWWAYMELGWGGYWAWDPVENASLIPWLIGTAALHTLIVEERRGKLGRVNVAMMALTTVSAFFATYLVRSGVIDSVHAFGDGSVGTPLTVFVLAGLAVTFWVACTAPREGKPLAGLDSREGFLTLVAWVLLALAAIILVATMWPVISKLWTTAPRGLDANFYNRVCLPLGRAAAGHDGGLSLARLERRHARQGPFLRGAGGVCRRRHCDLGAGLSPAHGPARRVRGHCRQPRRGPAAHGQHRPPPASPAWGLWARTWAWPWPLWASLFPAPTRRTRKCSWLRARPNRSAATPPPCWKSRTAASPATTLSQPGSRSAKTAGIWALSRRNAACTTSSAACSFPRWM